MSDVLRRYICVRKKLDMLIKKERITVRFDEEVTKSIKKQAEKEGRTKSNIIQLAVKKYLESVKQD